MNITNITKALNSSIQQDKNIGVKLALLTGNKNISVFAIELKKNQFIPAHYHKKGIETYYILIGRGVISIGKIVDRKVCWISKEEVKSGDCFTIYPNQVHHFENTSDHILRIIGTTPISHTKDDRYFV